MGADGAAASTNELAGDHAGRACRRVVFTCTASDEPRGRGVTSPTRPRMTYRGRGHGKVALACTVDNH